MKIFLIVLAIILVLVVLVLILGLSGVLFRFGAKVSDSQMAKANGQELLSKKRRVLAVAAHPDDLEYWPGGTLGELVKNGSDVTIVICTKNQTEGDIRKEEQLAAADILSYTKVIFLDLSDRYLSEHANELRQKLSDVFKEIKPDTVFTFDTEKEGPVYHHKDHETAGKITLEVAKTQKLDHIYFFHTSAPDTLVDISDIINKKLEALDAHKSQAHILLGFNFRDTQLRRMLSSYGKIIGVDYAEPFRKGW